MPKASWTCCAALSFATLATVLRADDEFPYTAFVAVERAEVVSGPGHRFYATDHLRHGAEVEVYREESSGWLAIRPPEGAFSWVPAEAIERGDDEKVGRVVEPSPAWIGTAAERVTEHRSQVTLKEGELVQILGEKMVAVEGQEQVWLKIAPPAGEFRWIHLRDVSRQKPEGRSRRPGGTLSEEGDVDPQNHSSAGEVSLAAEVPLGRRDLQDFPPGRRDLQVEQPVEPRRFEPVAAAIPLRDLAPADAAATGTVTRERAYRGIEQVQFRSSSEPPRPSLSPDGFVPRKRKAGSEQLDTVPLPSPQLTHRSSPAIRSPSEPAARIASLGSAATTSAAPAPGRPVTATPASSGDLAQQLEQIELDLSLMLAQDRSLWNLQSLKDRVNRIVESGPDPIARGRARLVLEKIEQFAEVFDVQHYGAIAAPAAASSTSSATDSLADPRYDGQGWLKPVVSRKGDKPPAEFALVDAEGKPVCFVTPSPGLNLHRYLNKHLGVYGRRGYIESLKTPHVVVERAIDLERLSR